MSLYARQIAGPFVLLLVVRFLSVYEYGLFASYNNIVVFYDMSWKNDLAYYNAVSGKITYYTDFTYTDEEIKKINEMIYNKINTSSLAIKNNYFAYLKEKIDERKGN